MSDLIERLRKGDEHEVWVLVDETVDEIERLETENRLLRSRLKFDRAYKELASPTQDNLVVAQHDDLVKAQSDD